MHFYHDYYQDHEPHPKGIYDNSYEHWIRIYKAFEYALKNFRLVAKKHLVIILTREGTPSQDISENSQQISTNKVSNESVTLHLLISRKKKTFFPVNTNK